MLNQKQQIILGASIFLVVLSGTFLPYEGECDIRDLAFRADMGYYFIFVPPTGKEVRKALPGSPIDNPNLYGSHIITSRVLVQVCIIIIATAGLLFLVAGKNSKESSSNSAGL